MVRGASQGKSPPEGLEIEISSKIENKGGGGRWLKINLSESTLMAAIKDKYIKFH